MKSKVFFVVTLFWVLFISTPASAQQEEITLSTYYPAPYGEYDELCAEKLLVWTPDAIELQYMGQGDCHIGNSLIVGAGATGFSYEELGGSLADGTVLIKGNVGIGTASPTTKFVLGAADGNGNWGHFYRSATESDLVLGAAQNYVAGRSLVTMSAYGYDFKVGRNSSTTATNNGTSAMVILESGNVGIGTTNPQNRLDVEGGLAVGATYSGTSAAPMNGMIIEGNVGIGTTSPDPNYRLDVNGNIKGGRTAEAWSANRTSYLAATSGGPWALIPGMSITFTLSRNALVQFMATGTQRTVNQASGTWIHCQYRFVVDGTPRGDPTYGQKILISYGHVSYHNAWCLSDFANLSAGSHTIRVEACNGFSGSTAIICGETSTPPSPPWSPGYTHGNLNILAVYN